MTITPKIKGLPIIFANCHPLSYAPWNLWHTSQKIFFLSSHNHRLISFCSHLNILTSKYEYPISISQIIIWHSLPYSFFQFFSTIIHIIQTKTSFHQGVKEEAFRELLTQKLYVVKQKCMRKCPYTVLQWRTFAVKNDKTGSIYHWQPILSL